jgi:hypothetical protein
VTGTVIEIVAVRPSPKPSFSYLGSSLKDGLAYDFLLGWHVLVGAPLSVPECLVVLCLMEKVE